MNRHEALQEIHERYQPRSYLEIGVSAGRSLALSRTRTIAVDPEFSIQCPIACDLRLVRASSDDFFRDTDVAAAFRCGVVDLTFIDGMHLFEFALRDFMNAERNADWTSVVVVDDVLPRTVEQASRTRATHLWAGDAFKLVDVLKAQRPDLIVLPLDTEPTGIAVVLGADPKSTVLRERYDDILGEKVGPDPQRVPDDVLRRTCAWEPRSFLESDVLARLRVAREAGLPREEAWPGIRRALEGAVRPASSRQIPRGAHMPKGGPRSQGMRGRRPTASSRRRALRVVRRGLSSLKRHTTSLRKRTRLS